MNALKAERDSATHSFSRAEKAGKWAATAFAVSPLQAVAASALLMGILFFRFVWTYSVNVFYMDQWRLLNAFLRHSPGISELFFFQWGPHREGVGLILNKVIYPLTAWNTRIESLMIGGAIFVAMLLAILLKHKLFGRVDYSDIAIPLMFLTLDQWETMVGTPNPAHSSFPLLMIMLYCLGLLQKNQFLKYLTILILNFLLIYTGFGLFMGVVTLGFFVVEIYRQWRWVRGAVSVPLIGLALGVASLASFFRHYTFSPGTFSPGVDLVFPYHPLTAYPVFMALMLWKFIGPADLWVIGCVVGSMIFISMVIVLGKQLRDLLKFDASDKKHLVLAVLLGFSLLFTINTAIGRVGFGRGGVVSRYMTLLIPAYLALYLYLLSIDSARTRKFAVWLFAMMLVPSAVIVRAGARDVSEGKRAWAACYSQREDIQYCDKLTNFKVFWNEDQDGNYHLNSLKNKLDYLKANHLSLFADRPDRSK